MKCPLLRRISLSSGIETYFSNSNPRDYGMRKKNEPVEPRLIVGNRGKRQTDFREWKKLGTKDD